MENQPKRGKELRFAAAVAFFLVAGAYGLFGSGHTPGSAPTHTTSTPVTTSVDTFAPPPVARGPAQPVTTRQWQLIAKDPASHVGEHITVVGTVTQFDTVTGPAKFLANVAATANGGGVNTMCFGPSAVFTELVAGDSFRATAVVAGTVDYQNTMNATITVPKLVITTLTRQ